MNDFKIRPRQLRDWARDLHRTCGRFFEAEGQTPLLVLAPSIGDNLEVVRKAIRKEFRGDVKFANSILPDWRCVALTVRSQQSRCENCGRSAKKLKTTFGLLDHGEPAPEPRAAHRTPAVCPACGHVAGARPGPKLSMSRAPDLGEIPGARIGWKRRSVAESEEEVSAAVDEFLESLHPGSSAAGEETSAEDSVDELLARLAEGEEASAEGPPTQAVARRRVGKSDNLSKEGKEFDEKRRIPDEDRGAFEQRTPIRSPPSQSPATSRWPKEAEEGKVAKLPRKIEPERSERAVASFFDEGAPANDVPSPTASPQASRRVDEQDLRELEEEMLFTLEDLGAFEQWLTTEKEAPDLSRPAELPAEDFESIVRMKTLLSEARRLIAAHQFEEALQVFDEASELDPTHPGLQRLREEIRRRVRHP